VLSIRTRQPASAAATDRVPAPYAGLSANQHMSAPTAATQGTAVSFAGRFGNNSAVALIDLPGSHPPREAPV